MITTHLEQSSCTHTENEEELDEHGTKWQDPSHQDSSGKKRKHLIEIQGASFQKFTPDTIAISHPSKGKDC